MKAWLKFYFLSFFSDRLSAEAAKRSFWNAALSILLTFVILCTGMFTGFVCSFGTHYKNAEEFREFLYGAFATAGEERINLSVSDGKLTADIPDCDSVNGFLDNNGAYGKNGYNLIVDTRPAVTTYDDFSVICTDGNANEISYAEYLELNENEKKNYTAQLELSGRTLDVTKKQSEYESYLSEKASSEGKAAFTLLRQRFTDGELSEAEYANQVYILYVRQYYPSLDRIEQYGEAPTLRTYYLGMITSDFSDSFLMLLDGLCVGSFKTSKGVAVDFEGYYSKLSGSITGDGMTEEQLRSNVDKFIVGAFEGSSGYNYLIYVFNVFKPVAVILIVMLVLAVIGFIICRYKFPQSGIGYIGVFKIICSFMLIASVLSFIIAVILSFTSPKNTAYLLTIVAFALIVVLRSAVILIHSIIEKRKRDAEQLNK